MKKLIPPLLLLSLLPGCAVMRLIHEPAPPTPEELQELEDQRVQQAVETHDLTLGMTMNEVLHAWGQPHQSENLDDGSRGNAEWTYSEGTTQLASQRVVYFERGRVVGWETH